MILELRISHKDIELIRQELDSNKPYEACGVLIGNINGSTANVENVFPIRNVLRTRRSFELDPEQFYKVWNDAMKKGTDIVGVYHTHPQSCAVPSQWDRETMENAPSVWLIAGVDGMRAFLWEEGIKNLKVVEY